MIMISIILFLSVCCAIPLSLKGFDKTECNLEFNYSCHYWFIAFGALGLMVTDMTAMNIHSDLKKIKS